MTFEIMSRDFFVLEDLRHLYFWWEEFMEIIQMLRITCTSEKVLLQIYFKCIQNPSLYIVIIKIKSLYSYHLNSSLNYLQWGPLLILSKLLQITLNFPICKTSFYPSYHLYSIFIHLLPSLVFESSYLCHQSSS